MSFYCCYAACHSRVHTVIVYVRCGPEEIPARCVCLMFCEGCGSGEKSSLLWAMLGYCS